MHKLHQKGIGSLAIIFSILVVGVISFAGWKVIESRSHETHTAQKSAQAISPVNEEKRTTQPEAAPTGTVITTGGSDYGTMLFNDKSQAIYIWEREDSTTPKCYDDCAEAWPPVLTDGTPLGTGEVKAELLGTVKRIDGSTQVTYNGHPLYYYAHENPGEVKCHNISTHGGLWWVIQPNGIRAS